MFDISGMQAFNTTGKSSSSSVSSSDSNQAKKSATLEDLMNDLIGLDTKPVQVNVNNLQNTQNSSFISNNLTEIKQLTEAEINSATGSTSLSGLPTVKSSFNKKKALPEDVVQDLYLPHNVDGIYSALRRFFEESRNRPYIETSSGRFVYISYDPEIQRIRVYIGSKRSFASNQRGVKEMSGRLPLEELYEYWIDSKEVEVLGFKRRQNFVAERYRQSSDLIGSSNDIGLNKLKAVLYFSYFLDRSGVSAATVKIESV